MYISTFNNNKKLLKLRFEIHVDIIGNENVTVWYVCPCWFICPMGGLFVVSCSIWFETTFRGSSAAASSCFSYILSWICSCSGHLNSFFSFRLIYFIMSQTKIHAFYYESHYESSSRQLHDHKCCQIACNLQYKRVPI